MIIVMKRSASEAEIDHMISEVESAGLKPTVLRGTERTVIAAIGDERKAGDLRKLESAPGVDNVMPVLAPYKLASIETQANRSVVRAGSLSVGGSAVGMIAGPCSVETEEQIVATAKAVKTAGATALRGGAFKPRTSPYSFQGLKEEGLKMLAAARDETGLAIVTEVVSPEDVELVGEYAEVLQIGARNMQNYRLLEACGKSHRAVLLKRGPSATIDELLLAAEYILDGGNPNVMLCERGIRTYETHTRFTLPLASVPYLQAKTHLPVVIDPSHGTGHASLVPAMARAAVAAGADGIIVEVHPEPEHAMSDGYQTLDCPTFAAMMEECRRVAAAVDRSM
jgi:3-deoxy-7-phosphoheptulonate synthase